MCCLCISVTVSYRNTKITYFTVVFIFYIKYLFKKLELSAVSAVPFKVKVVPVSKKFPMG